MVGLAPAAYTAINNTLVLANPEPRFHGRVMSVYPITFAVSPVAALPMSWLADRVGAPRHDRRRRPRRGRGRRRCRGPLPGVPPHPLRAAYPRLGRSPSPRIVAPGSCRLSGRNAHDAATSTAIDSGAATCHHSPPVAIEADAAPVRSNMIPA